MQRLFFAFFLSCLAVTACAQNNTPEVKNNATNSNTAVPDTVKMELAVPAEKAVILREESISKQKGSADKKARSAAPAYEKSTEAGKALEDVESEKIDSPSTAPAVQMQQQFETNQYNSSRQYNRRSASPVEQMNMDASAEYYRNEAPNSFESHFYTWMAGHYNTDLYPELQAAAALNPGNPEVKKQQAAYYIIKQEPGNALPLIRQLIDKGTISAGQLVYANDLLISGDTQTVIVLHGFDDMFATYYVQNKENVRPDVDLLSLDFMQSETYRASWVEKDFVLPESNVIDTAYLAELCRLNPDKKWQLSLTIPKDYFVGIKNELYPVGLTFRYSQTPVENYIDNYRLWSEKMNLKLVRNSLNDSGDNWCTNYLPMLVTLRRQLEAMGLDDDVEKLNKDILSIGSRSNNTSKVKKYTE